MKHIFFIGLALTLCSCSAFKSRDYINTRILDAVRTARSYTGTPYRYGGTSRQGMDCSGLLCMSFQAAGLELPRTSQEQSKMGTPIKISDLRPGDLVFFSAKKGRKKISHVGMVTEVISSRDIQFIHSSTRLGVVENNLLSDYYRSIFVKARRPF